MHEQTAQTAEATLMQVYNLAQTYADAAHLDLPTEVSDQIYAEAERYVASNNVSKLSAEHIYLGAYARWMRNQEAYPSRITIWEQRNNERQLISAVHSDPSPVFAGQLYTARSMRGTLTSAEERIPVRLYTLAHNRHYVHVGIVATDGRVVSPAELNTYKPASEELQDRHIFKLFGASPEFSREAIAVAASIVPAHRYIVAALVNWADTMNSMREGGNYDVVDFLAPLDILLENPGLVSAISRDAPQLGIETKVEYFRRAMQMSLSQEGAMAAQSGWYNDVMRALRAYISGQPIAQTHSSPRDDGHSHHTTTYTNNSDGSQYGKLSQ